MSASHCLKNPLLFLVLALLYLSYFYSYCLPPVFLSLLVLIFPFLSPAFVFKRKQLCEASSMEMPVESKDDVKISPDDQAVKGANVSHEDQTYWLNDPVNPGPPDPPMECEDIEVEMIVAGSEGKISVFSIGNEDMLLGDMDCMQHSIIVCSSCSISGDESPSEGMSWSPRSSEGLSSEDEGLIEIAIPEGHYIEPGESNAPLQPSSVVDILPSFLPESVIRQHGLMELLSEINEDDNLMEIDIVMGSIKCSTLGIKA